jgi:plastocyanin
MRNIISCIILCSFLARADNFAVNVGVGGLIFTPNTVNANAGDTIEFIVSGVCDSILPLQKRP